ncbi:hypothetical protein SAMN04488057_106138 [Cyclobacterium lianum]|uniref:Por secretion system C-terminal sorting domain-containing protein n=1 Tax=Cyclobacterium lianum TaxID=388280 RepID=A0A1M7NX28_9BACT|nr:hypothetical protein [Cyclobacterium lianum]SHN08584.1 hypothetical protein SAMN04488057_106138 [Cyclobacterium lianum]
MNEEKITLKPTFLSILLSLFFLSGMFTVWAQNVIRPIETEISFPRELNSPDVNFDLKSLGNKKFKLVLEKPNQSLTNVKIYDILGNLILHDKLKPADGVQKNYDFTHLNSKLFVVEVGNARYNKTKSVYANPQGTMESNVSTTDE